MYKFSKKSLDNLKGVHPDLVECMHISLKESPVDFGITCGVRTIEQQQDLFAKGRSMPGPIVTWTMNSKHLVQPDGFGHAVDIAAYISGKISWNAKYYDIIGKVVKDVAQKHRFSVEWGGDWKRKDRPHFEIKER